MRNRSKKGFSFIEIMLAIGVVTIAIIPLVGLIPLGLKNTQISSEEIAAAHLLQMVVQDFRHTPPSESRSAILKLENPPYQATSLGEIRRVWIDLALNVYLERPSAWVYEMEWHYLKIPSLSDSFEPVECKIRIRWPVKTGNSPDITSSKSWSEISSRVVFLKK